MVIRILQESDAHNYHELRLTGLRTNPEAFGSTYEREAQFAAETVIERIRPSKDKFVLGAFSESGSLSGIVAFVRDTGIKTAHKAHLYGMYVAEESRGQGLGRSLMQACIRMARECEGLEHIQLTVVSRNEAARKLYESLGFELYGVERNALKLNGRYDDEALMVLYL
ncbi:GNAT family N-acetyltransferase [Paenibacillaceae bacterium WGS1546]|uniref:GNAT family N-acetyltransferase n=1 Tax=Cohnella sp. WGS1546 TaxID=3366810 RepID=UPI00372D352B